MAVKASASVTLSSVVDVKSVWRYYKLQSSTLSKPEKPATNPPSGWITTEPSYTNGSTNSLYLCDLTVFSDNTFTYSDVSLSSSYEVAKEAWNKAKNAQDSADNAQSSADNANTSADNAIKNIQHLNAELTEHESAVESRFTDMGEYVDGKTEVVDTWLRQGSTGTTPFLELGTSAGSFNARLTNSKLSFLEGNEELAYFGNKQMHISDADIDSATIDRLKIGKYALVANSDGHLTVVYVG